MVNPYPYFGYSPEQENFALFKPNSGLHDKYTKQTYTNMFDLLIDAVHISMKKLGYGDVEIAVGETGWASVGETFEPKSPRAHLPVAKERTNRVQRGGVQGSNPEILDLYPVASESYQIVNSLGLFINSPPWLLGSTSCDLPPSPRT
ncbi:Glucan endo-1 [Forsythia ovata]|uniref:Glucan endo-1 n=1 Tax=Forsythia ovata TaxID=205694 RepID=A0ABD1WSZ0_9LAMI